MACETKEGNKITFLAHSPFNPSHVCAGHGTFSVEKLPLILSIVYFDTLVCILSLKKNNTKYFIVSSLVPFQLETKHR